jgi:hypothetical protein
MGLLGFKGQGLAGEKAPAIAYFTVLNPGDTSWVCPRAGRYTFTIRGGGDCGIVGSNPGGYSGAAAARTIILAGGHTLPISVGRGGSRDTSQGGQPPGRGTATSITFSDRMMVAEAGNGVTGVAASAYGGDLNVAGNTTPGDGAPAIGGLPVVPASSSTYLVPGAGASNTTYGPGGPGVVLIFGESLSL